MYTHTKMFVQQYHVNIFCKKNIMESLKICRLEVIT